LIEFWVWDRSAAALPVSQVVVYRSACGLAWALGWGAG
jgi:hypothetical protein